MNHKIKILLTAGSLPFMVASTAMAAAPGGGGFGQYTVTAGTITDTMTGTTAATVTLASGNGFLQQKVTTAEGTFYRTVILDSNATGTDAAGVTALGFRNETFVDTISSSGNMASDGHVALAAPTGVATAGAGSTSNVTLAGVTLPTNSLEAVIARGSLATTGTTAEILAGTADPTGIKILQAHDFGVDTDASGVVTTEVTGKSGSMQVNFQFLSQGEAAAQEDRDNFMRLDQGRFAGTDTNGDMTVRRTSGDFTTIGAHNDGSGHGVLELPDGQTLLYAAGDDISTTWVDNGTLGGGTFGYPTTGTAVGNSASANGVNQTQSFRNYSDAQRYLDNPADPAVLNGGIAGVEWVNDSQRFVATNSGVIAGSMTGYPQMLFTPLITGVTAATSWPAANWDTNFGTAPVAMAQNTAGTALVKPASMTAAFPQ